MEEQEHGLKKAFNADLEKNMLPQIFEMLLEAVGAFRSIVLTWQKQRQKRG